MSGVFENFSIEERSLLCLTSRALRESQHGFKEGDLSAGVLLLAQAHGVDVFLYNWLCGQRPELFDNENRNAHPVAVKWRTLSLAAVMKYTQAVRQLVELLKSLQQHGVDVMPLKGAWLGQTLYGASCLRTMSDIDLLVRADQRVAAHEVMLRAGYRSATAAMQNRFAHAQSYRHPQWGKAVEVHWSVASELDPAALRVDMASVWRQAVTAQCAGCAVSALPPAELLAHLIHHAMHHHLAVPLRSWLDMALLLKKHGDEFEVAVLEAAAQRWGVVRAMPFALRFVSDLLELPLPSALECYAPALVETRRQQALLALFNLTSAQGRAAESTLLRFKGASRMGRVRLALARIFMAREFLVRDYPCARHWWGVPIAWVLRLRHLWLNHAGRVQLLLREDGALSRQLEIAAQRRGLIEWLLGK